MVPQKNMEYEEYLAKANSGAFQAASPGPPSGKTIAGKRGENITTLLPSSAFQRAMAEQTMVALLWQQGDARGTLNLPASTKVEDLKLRLNASDCDAVMFDAVIIEVRKAGSVLKRKLDTQKQDAVVDPSWTLILSKPPAEEPPPEPLTEVRVYTHQSGDLALEGCISSLTGSLPLGHEGRGQASPVGCILGSQGAKHAALASCGVAGKPC